MAAKRDIPAIVYAGFTIFLLIGTFLLDRAGERRRAELEEKLWRRDDGTPAVCVIQVREQDDSSTALLTGYNYHLLELFSQYTGKELDIRLAGRGRDYTDSLRSGAIDILVVPSGRGDIPQGCISSRVLDSTSRFLFNGEQPLRLKQADKWICLYEDAEWRTGVRERFFRLYSPLSKKNSALGHLSPYDDLIRDWADSIGWDWRLLAAVIYQESHFKIEAVSRRGATGLMQLMSNSSDEKDLVNPAKNIRAGARLLAYLDKRYRGVAPDPAERKKIVLAAYNAGIGRMRDVLGYAACKGVRRSSWDSLAAIIPQMRDSTNLVGIDTVKLGTFHGLETISYVEKVMGTYEQFKTLKSE